MKPKYLEVSPDDLKKVLQRKRRHEAAKVKVSPEELFIAEFGYHFGWEAMVALMHNEITLDDANIMLAGANKVWASKLIDLASVVYTASAAAQSGKKSKTIMTNGLRAFINQAKADL